MGFLDRARDVRAMYADGRAGVEQWARIVRIGRGVGRLRGFDLEIHSNGQPPFIVGTKSMVPRSITPYVGQDVAYREARHDESTIYQIEWDQPPRYGQGA
jgi:hypothetical protein